jgi:CDP-glycerol glycerophosphotransferase (TagB/SpsB family)
MESINSKSLSQGSYFINLERIKAMDNDNLLKMAICSHFFSTFRNLKYRGIEVARYLFYEFFLNLLPFFNINEILKAIPGISQDVTRADVFSLVDGEYSHTAKPKGKILIEPREFLKEVISMLPAERIVLPAGQILSNPVAVAQLQAVAKMELQRCSGDYLFGSSLFRDWFINHLAKVVGETDQLANLFDREAISCVVTRFGYWYFWPCRPLLWLAKSRGIPSIAYQPAVLIGNNEKADRWWPIADIPIIASYKTIWGQQFKEFFMSFGVPENRAPVIGNPHFDRIKSYLASSNGEFRRKYGIPDSHKVILHPTESPDFRRLATVKVAVEAIQALPDTTLLIKTRDQEYPEEKEIYNDIIREHPRIKVLDANQPIYDLIANSDVVLVFFSTCGVEAMLFGKPVVIIDVKREEPPYSYTELGAPEAQNGAELEALLRKLFSDPDYRQEVRTRIAERLPYLCLPDGKATSRLAEFILKVADGDYLL